MKTRQDVINAWERGDRARSGNLSTDGVWLWSYDLKIGQNLGSGPRVWRELIVFDYTAHGGPIYSQTTKDHIGLAKQVADTIKQCPFAREPSSLPTVVQVTRSRNMRASTRLCWCKWRLT